MNEPARRAFPAFLLISFLAVFVWSGALPKDRTVWVLEVTPAIIGVLLVVLFHRRFSFTTLSLGLIWIHAIILLIGGHYTYAEVPAFNWFREACSLSRNHYDRLGHWAQGFCPAIYGREILLRTSPLKPGKWLFFLMVSVCLAISAFYELIEWWVALTSSQSAEAFLGTQGDVWDTQWDMFTALIGAIVAQLLLSRLHDRQIARLPGSRMS